MGEKLTGMLPESHSSLVSNFAQLLVCSVLWLCLIHFEKSYIWVRLSLDMKMTDG